MLTSRFDDAFRFAHDLHRTQTRKGTTIPYISHLMGAAALVIEHGGDEDQAIAALLHDGPEDQGGRATLQDIERRFGAPASPRSSRTAPTPGRSRSPIGAPARKPISRNCRGRRSVRCWSRSPTRPTTPKPFSTTIARLATRSGRASTAARTGRAGIIASSPISSPAPCRAGCLTGCRARSKSFRREAGAFSHAADVDGAGQRGDGASESSTWAMPPIGCAGLGFAGHGNLKNGRMAPPAA